MDEIKVTATRATVDTRYHDRFVIPEELEVIDASVADDLLRALVAEQVWSDCESAADRMYFRMGHNLSVMADVEAWLEDRRRAAIANARKP